ncbi:hypothetical protein BW247_05090 [Acidihalobacter ferrooxydans]|uniref:P-type conjugative transfer protein TrbJ n=2 Tax=Acidihalobacter ferrooxydans TaxID=1765967 RepID=A0A1P8UFL4_9GAMM|nr:hypothetical protein BW247_05090 [Acidihalobacter ferrooxydans]
MLKSYQKGKAGPALLSLAILAGIPSAAHAMASGSIVFDPSNFAENSISAAKMIKQIEADVEQYALQKYGIDVNLNNLSQSALNSLMQQYPPQSQYQMDYLTNLARLEKSLGVAQQSVTQQYQAYSASGLTPSQYVAQEQQIAASNQAHSAAQYSQAVNALHRVNALAATVKKQGKSIGTLKGASKQRNLLNMQLHTLIQQNQMLLKLVATSAANKGGTGTQKAAAQKKESAYLKSLRAFLAKQPTVQSQMTSAGNTLAGLKPKWPPANPSSTNPAGTP